MGIPAYREAIRSIALETRRDNKVPSSVEQAMDMAGLMFNKKGEVVDRPPPDPVPEQLLSEALSDAKRALEQGATAADLAPFLIKLGEIAQQATKKGA